MRRLLGVLLLIAMCSLTMGAANSSLFVDASKNITLAQLNFLFQDFYTYDSKGLLYRYYDSGFVCGGYLSSVCLQSNVNTFLSVFKESVVYPISTPTRSFSLVNDSVVVLYTSTNATSVAASLLKIAIGGVEVLENLLPNATVALLEALVLPTLAKAYNEASRAAQAVAFLHCARNITNSPAIDAPYLDNALSLPEMSVYRIDIHHVCACSNLPSQQLQLCSQSPPGPQNPIVTWYDDNLDVEQCVNLSQVEQYSLSLAAVFVCLFIWVVDLVRVVRQGRRLGTPYGCGAILRVTPPINFLDRSASYVVAAIAGCMSNILFTLVASSGAPEASLTVMMQFLPMFLCYGTESHLVGATVGTLYSLAFCLCQCLVLGCYGAHHSKFIALLNVPSVFFSAFVVGWFMIKFYSQMQAIVHRRAHSSSAVAHSISSSSPNGLQNQSLAPHQTHVRRLLRSVHQQLRHPTTVIVGTRRVLSHVKDYFAVFRFSTRMLSVLVLVTALLYCCVVTGALVASLLSSLLVYLLSGGRCCWDQPCNDAVNSDDWIGGVSLSLFSGNFAMDIGGSCSGTFGLIGNGVIGAFLGSGLIAAIINEAYLLHTMHCYRQHMLGMFRGEHLTKQRPSPSDCIMSCVRYAGYQIAYLVFGWLLGTCILVLFCLLVTFTTILPILKIYGFGFWNWVLVTLLVDPETGRVGILAAAIFNFIGVWILVQWFLQHAKNSVAITSRFRIIFHFVDFIELLVYTVNGLFSFISRVLHAFFYILLFISRLDKALTPRGHELSDPGFSAYLGFLYVELYYSHPVFLVANALFVDHLNSSNEALSVNTGDCLNVSMSDVTEVPGPDPAATSSLDSGGGHGGLVRRNDAVFRRARNRWQLYYTLLKNPILRRSRVPGSVAASPDLPRLHPDEDKAAAEPASQPAAPVAAAELVPLLSAGAGAGAAGAFDEY